MSIWDRMDEGDLALVEAFSRPFREQAERHRLRSTATGVLTLSGLLALGDYPPERIAIVAGVIVIMSAWMAFHARRCGAQLRPQPWFFLAPFVVVAVTGGVRSPIFPAMMFGLAPYLFIASRRERSGRWMWCGAGLVAVLMILPQAITGPAFAAPFDALLTGITLVIALVKVGVMMRRSHVADDLVEDEMRQLRGDLLHEAHERSRTFEAVGAKVGHELKTPLAAIRVLLDLEQRRATDPVSQERLARATDEVKRLSAIVNDYLVLAKPVESIDVEEYDLADVTRDVVTMFDAGAARAGVSIVLENAPGELPVSGDRRRIREALVNLVANAIEASPSGRTVRLAVEDEDERVRVTVTDEGRGIPAHLLPRVGTAFFTTREGGTGLGIVLARMVVLQHGGRLSFDSVEGQGTRVTFWLPRAVEARVEPTSSRQPLPTLEEASLGA